MPLIIHVCLALFSLAYTAYAYAAPSLRKLRAAYALVAASTASGAYLIWSSHAQMTQACVTGLVYLGVVIVSVVAVRAKLADREY